MARQGPPSPGGGGSAAQPPGRGEPPDRLARFRRTRARQLRSRTTSAEQLFWRALERIPLDGTHFRRQVPIGPYIADFACLAAHLVIELDGAPHSREDVAARDRKRQAWLEQEGYRVLRFWNEDVFVNLDGVLDTVYATLYGGIDVEATRFVHRRRPRLPHPTPALRADPPPSGEGDREPD